eukprot:gene3745-13805_t
MQLGMPPLVTNASLSGQGPGWATSLKAGRPLSAQPRQLPSRQDLVRRRPQSAQAQLSSAPSPSLHPPQADQPTHSRSHGPFTAMPRDPSKDPREPLTLPGTGPPRGLGSSMLPLPTPPRPAPASASQPLPSQPSTPLSDAHTLTPKRSSPEGALLTLSPSAGRSKRPALLQPTRPTQPHGMTALPPRTRRLPPLAPKRKDDPHPDPTLYIVEPVSSLRQSDDGEFTSPVKCVNASTLSHSEEGEFPSHVKVSPRNQAKLDNERSGLLYDEANPEDRAASGSGHGVDSTGHGSLAATDTSTSEAVNPQEPQGGCEAVDSTAYGGRDVVSSTAYGGRDAADMSTTSRAGDPEEPQRVELVARAGGERKSFRLPPSNYMSEAFYLLEGEDLVSMVRQKVSLLTDELWAMVEEVNGACEWIQSLSFDTDGHIERLLAGKEALDAADRQAKGLSVAMNFAREQDRVRRKRAADAQTAILAERQADGLGAALQFAEHARLLRQQNAEDQERAKAHANGLALAMQFAARAKQEREDQVAAVEAEKKLGSYATQLGVAMRFAKQTHEREERVAAADLEKLGSYATQLGIAKTEGREGGGHTGVGDSNRILEDLKAFQCRPILPPRKRKVMGQPGRATPTRGWNHRRRVLEQFYNSVDRRGEF